MMKILRWIVAVPIIVAAVLFALAHPQPVDFVWSPVNNPITIPLYVLTLGLCAVGFILGALAAWFGMSGLRRERRTQKKTIKQLEKDLAAAHDSAIKAREETRAAHEHNQQQTPQIGPISHV